MIAANNSQDRAATNLEVTSLPQQPHFIPLSPCRRWWLQLCYGFKSQRGSLTSIILGFVVLLCLVAFFSPWRLPFGTPSSTSPSWTDWFSRVQDLVGFLTLVVAVVVWLGELRDNWEISLPKRMSVFFFSPATKDKPARPVIVSRNVWLAGEDDLRQWGMQVATQSVTSFVSVPNPNQLRLDFGLDVFAGEGCVLVNAHGHAHKHYTIRFNLTRLPGPLEQVWQGGPTATCLYQNLLAENPALLQVPVAEVEVLHDDPDWPKAAKM